MTLTVATPADLLGLPGTPVGPTPWMEIDAERIRRFAEATGDQPVDEPLGQEYLTLALVNLFLPQLLTVETFSMGINVGLERVRFPSPVRVGDSIRGRGEVVSAAEVGGGVQVVVRIGVDVAGSDKRCCVADTVSRFIP